MYGGLLSNRDFAGIATISCTKSKCGKATSKSPNSREPHLDFPLHPTMGQSPAVGLQQQMNAILEQQRQQQQQQQQHQQQVNLIMSKLINMKM